EIPLGRDFAVQEVAERGCDLRFATPLDDEVEILRERVGALTDQHERAKSQSARRTPGTHHRRRDADELAIGVLGREQEERETPAEYFPPRGDPLPREEDRIAAAAFEQRVPARCERVQRVFSSMA